MWNSLTKFLLFAVPFFPKCPTWWIIPWNSL
jgi:hypothetical protein